LPPAQRAFWPGGKLYLYHPRHEWWGFLTGLTFEAYLGGRQMKKILIVDDEESIRLLYKEELEEEGFAVELANNGRDALEKLPLFNPDLITLDIKMPVMDGIEALKRIREVDRQLPIILCSAYGEYKQDFTTWASDAYVVKCADLTDLKSTIRRLLGLL
jgi:CheY-like chemotaxis protein